MRFGAVCPLAALLSVLATVSPSDANPVLPAASVIGDAKPSSTSPAGQSAAAGLRADLISSAAWCDAVRAFALAALGRAIKDGELGSGALLKAASRSLELLAGHYREATAKLPADSALPANRTLPDSPTPPAPSAPSAPSAPLNPPAPPVAELNGKPENKPSNVSNTATPVVGLVIPEIKTSTENLRALALLMAARRTGPLTELAARWRTAPHRQSSQVFRFEREALTELGRFATESAEQPDGVRRVGKIYYISRPCGYVANQLSADRCPVCKASRDTFEKSE